MPYEVTSLWLNSPFNIMFTMACSFQNHEFNCRFSWLKSFLTWYMSDMNEHWSGRDFSPRFICGSKKKHWIREQSHDRRVSTVLVGGVINTLILSLFHEFQFSFRYVRLRFRNFRGPAVRYVSDLGPMIMMQSTVNILHRQSC